MSIEEKAGQFFMTFFWGSKLDGPTRKFFTETHIGNVLYFSWANGLSSALQVASLSEEVSNFIYTQTKLAPFIAADQEGGPVTRLQNGGTHFPSPLSIAKSQDPFLARQVGRAVGRELTSVGVNLNLAPVVDVNTHFLNSPLHVRSFGPSAQLVTEFARSTMQGLKEEGVFSCLKHAPGYGSARKDAHEETPISQKSLEELEEVDFVPFKELACEAPFIMTAHLLYPALDPINIATFSPTIIQGIIREKWRYPGIVISDSLSMNAALKRKNSFGEAKESMLESAIKAFLAGCDLMILSKLEWTSFTTTREQDYQLIEYVINGFVQAVKTGIIPMEQVDASLRRILRLKNKMRPFVFQKTSPVHEALAFQIAEKSLAILAPRPSSEATRHLLVFPQEYQDIFSRCLDPKAPSFGYPLQPQESSFSSLTNWIDTQCAQSDSIVFFTCRPHQFPDQEKLLQDFLAKYPDRQISIVHLCSDQVEENPKHPTYLTYSIDPFSIQNVLRVIQYS